MSPELELIPAPQRIQGSVWREARFVSAHQACVLTSSALSFPCQSDATTGVEGYSGQDALLDNSPRSFCRKLDASVHPTR
jgi:hypothetical protein